jgi:integrase
MALTDIKVKALKAGIKPDKSLTNKSYKVTDERGLYLEVTPSGSKLWRFKYRIDGKEKLLSLGIYPDISLKEARASRDEFRKQVANGINPSDVRKAKKRSREGYDTFEFVAREWHEKFKHNWTDNHAHRTLARLEQNVFPWLGKNNISEITSPDLLTALRRVEERGALETAHRIKQICGQVFRYAIATGRAEHDITLALKEAIPPAKAKHHSTITDPREIGCLLRAIDGYEGMFITKCALKLAPLVFVRPGELRHAEWSEFDINKAEWRIPAEKMKMRSLHIVPLSSQALSVLAELSSFSGEGKYLFPSVRSKTRPMSNNTVNAALRRLGYQSDDMTGHGFRSMASTLLNENGWNKDAVERQLAHTERNNVRAAYNYAEYLLERKKMMQFWADYLDSLKIKAE